MEKSFEKYVVSTSSTGGKFWEVEVVGNDMKVRYGKLGADAKWSTKTFDSPEKALKEAEKKLRSKTNKGYAEAPRPTEVSADGVKIADGPFAGVFYFRAFDRYPGGNADMFTVKVTLTVVDGSGSLKAQSHRNWDGEHWIYSEAPVTLDVSDALPGLIDAAQAAIDGGLNEGVFTIIDPRTDSEEYDTEWSSLEFSLYTLPDAKTAPEDGTLAVHIVQKAMSFTNQKGNPPDDVSKAFIDAVHATVGIGRVENFADNEAPFSDAFNPDGESQGYQDKDVPLYLS